jgi:hypothetical protein
MIEPTISVKLTYSDLTFIHESIGQNVPSDEHRTAKERATADKVLEALVLVRKRSCT